MLQLTDDTIELMLKHLIIMKVGENKKQYKMIHIDKLKYISLKAFIDAFVVGGISFFSLMVVLGYDNLLLNVKVAVVSSMITSGLTFFTELRKYKLSDIVNTKK